MAYSRIRPRRGTAYEWSTINPILESGEWGVEVPDQGIGEGFCRFKIGNGLDRWNSLKYAFDGTTAASIDGGSVTDFHVIQLRAGLLSTWEDINPVLNANEPVFITDLNTIKVGDGEHEFTELPFINAGSLVNDMFDFGDEDGDDEIYSAADRSRVENQVEDMSTIDSVIGIDSLIDENP